MCDTFDYTVSGAADRNQAISQMIDGLMVSGIYHGAHTVELVKEIPAAQTAVIDMMKLVAANPFMTVCRDDILKQVAAKMYVDELETFADAKHRLGFRDKAGECFQLQNIEYGVHVEGTVICLAEEGGSDIAASGEEQMCRVDRFVRIGRSEVGYIDSIQCAFIVSGILFVAKDGYGWAFVHNSFLRNCSVTLCYAAIMVWWILFFTDRFL